MKAFLITLTLFLSLQSMGAIQSATITASGLTCAMCSKAIFKSLQRLSFVEKIDVDIKGSAYQVQFRSGSQPDPDQLVKAVEDAGFSVAKMVLLVSFNQQQVQHDAHIRVDGRIFHFVQVKNQVLNGNTLITVIDKQFTTDKTYKKFRQHTQKKCFDSGHAATCCDGAAPNERIYHVTI